ncbi:MAG: TetR/AcrR family transcriptional regulator [Prochloraceae cyanobacterium]
MSKAQETRDKIVQQAAELFNTKGYSGASISDIMRATGLKKGGIYNHFKSKEELTLFAFDYAFQCVSQRLQDSLRTKGSAKERLIAVVSTYLSYVEDPPIVGGCPILNAAIESDDIHSALRDRVLQAMNSWRSLISRLVEKGIAKGEINSKVEPDKVATIVISTIEGAIMMSKLYRDPIHLKIAVKHLQEYLQNQL